MPEIKTGSPGSGFEAVDFDPFSSGEIQQVVPSTEAQKEIWLSAQFGDSANCAFNESMSFHIDGVFDPEAFRQCIADIIERHDALRATFSTDGTTMSIAADLKIDVPIVDLTAEPDKISPILDDYVRSEVTRPFDLARGPLVRATILKVQENAYRALFSAHHIICDGWSMAVIIQDLRRLYNSKINATEADLPAPYRFSDYALEDERQRLGQLGRDAEAFWLSLYSQDVPLLDIPSDRTRPVMRTFDADRLDYTLDADIVKLLKKTGAKYGCTFIIALIAAFKTYLYRLTSQQRIVLGTPAAGQLATGRDHLVGHCVNLLPLVSTLDPSQPFCEYLKTVRNLMFDANQHQRFTFGSLIKKLKIQRDSSRIPLIPIIFNIDQQTKEDEITTEGFDFDVSTNPRKFENFELFLNLSSSARGHRVVIECTYNVNLFDEATVRYRLAEFETLLTSVAQFPELPLSTIPLLPEKENRLLLADFIDTVMDYPRDRCFYQLFEDQAALHPERTAVAFKGESITYSSLNRKANQLAHYLIDTGVRPNSLVGLFMDRSIDMMIALLGTLKAGGAYVPLDPDYPKDRLSYMLEESRSPVLITQAKFKAAIPASDARVIFLDADWDSIGKMRHGNPGFKDDGQRPGPESLAYVIFTSGSTGKPKGVQVPHRAVTNFLAGMRRAPGITDEDIMLAVTTLSFDIHVLELYLPLSVGAKVVLADRETAADGIRLVELLRTCGATVMQATPSTWRMMIGAGWGPSRQLKVLCGGEAFPGDLVDALLARAGSVWNMYGPTETTVWSTCQRLTRDDDRILVGRPIGNTQTYVLDANMQPVPIGVPGELYIGGDGVSHGYLNRPELTRQVFLSDPFSGRPDAFIYKTGDRVKYHADGAIEYLSRLDNQVKVRGFRIELGEIETVLSSHPAVKQAVAAVKVFGPDDQRLVGYYDLKNGQSIDVAEFRNHLRQKLPDYMIPQHFVATATFPLTPAGKIDRNAMPFPDDRQIGAADAYVAPTTPIEKEIAAIWETVLKVDRVGLRNDFFDLGGHSLLGMQVINRLRKLYSITLSIAAIFEAPTVEQMGRLIETTLGGAALAGDSSDKPVSPGREVFEI